MSGKTFHLTVTDSTNLHTMRELGQSGMNDWDVVVADYQTEGKGQRGRMWESQVGMNLTCSVVMKPQLHASKYFILSAITSLALVDALAEYNLKANVKWPNDILIDGNKVAGILIETLVKGNDIESAVIGIGMNVNQSLFEGKYNWPPTSVKLETGKQVDYSIMQILNDVVKHLKRYRKMLLDSGDLMIRLNEQLYSRGKAVSITMNGQTSSGVVREVNELGELVLNIDGEIRKFQSGEISLR